VFKRAADENFTGRIFTIAFEPTVTGQFADTVVDITESRGGEVLFVGLKCYQRTLEKCVSAPSGGESEKLTSVKILQELMENGAWTRQNCPGPN